MDGKTTTFYIIFFYLAIDSSLIDAFVIGSRAREHLQQITKDANITPRDIAQLSQILSESK